MRRVLRSALVIARRDYVATVWSRTFLLFLIGPLFPILFGALFGSVGAKMQGAPTPPVIAIVTDAADGEALEAARARLAQVAPLPDFRIVPPGTADVGALLSDPRVNAVLTGLPAAPVLHGTREAIDGYAPRLAFLIEEMHRPARAMPILERKPVARPARDVKDGRLALARGGQMALVVLTMILAGMLLSNLIEEKSNKVIEVLAAAVPVDAIFIGKLAAMLGMSLTGIAVWGATAFVGTWWLAPGLIAGMATPAVGWPLFIALGVLYFMASYLLVGALFLGIGAQAASVREVQTLSMPLTMGQLIFFWLAATALDDPGGRLGIVAMLVPWSSPFMMFARAAQDAAVWPHLLGLLWQVSLIALIVVLGARMFRLSVLKSGGRGIFGRRRS